VLVGWLVALLVGDYLLFSRDFERYVSVFMNMHAFITVAMVW
jgi:hypothetical protein